MRYRRQRVPGGTYFFTVVAADRRPILSTPDDVQRLRSAFRYTLERHPFRIDAIVVLPDHLHAVWTLPPDGSDYSTRWRLIKGHFTRHVPRSDKLRADQAVWQDRFWEHQIRDERDLAAHIDYVHFNPVKHGLVEHPAEWPYSSFHRYVAEGAYGSDWAMDEAPLEGTIGRE